MVQFDIITLFPRMFDSPLQESILQKARLKGLMRISMHDLRDYAEDKHRTADDTPYGGGAGMVMKVEPIIKAFESIKSPVLNTRTILLSPQGALLNQDTARRLSTFDQIIILCGRYEGFDERVVSFVDEEISIGDYILTGGEFAALVLVDAVARLIPGVVGDMASVLEDTFSNWLLKYPQYTRPAEFRGLPVPDVLMSGDHQKISIWRRHEALAKTLKRRPELLEKAELTDEDKMFLKHLQHT